MQQDSTKTIVRSIRINLIGLLLVRSPKQRSFSQTMIKLLKSILTPSSPIPANRLFRQVRQRHCYRRVVINELAKIVTQTQERPNIVNVLRHRPRLNSTDFLGIWTNALSINNMPQVLNLSLSKTGLCLCHVKLFATQDIQNKPHMRLMLFFRL